MKLSVRTLAVFAATGLLSACSKSTEPTSTNSIVVSPSASISLQAINASVQLVVKVVDQVGDSIPGQTFTFSSNNSTVAQVSATGLVTAKANGSATITVTSGSLNKQVSVTVAQVVAQTSKLGDNQIGVRNQALGQSIVLVVKDANGTPIPGVSVTFAALTGGGSVAPTTMTTDVSGSASTTWTLGSATTIQTAAATVAPAAPLTYTANAIPPTAAGFQVVVVNVGPPFSTAVQTAFDSATAFWQRVITGDLPDVPSFTVPTNSGCQNSSTLGPLTLDDVIILARFDSIDGPGKILGQAGACYQIRSTGGPSEIGVMIFDTADVATLIQSNSLNLVIRHEMGHVLGFGTLWDAAVTARYGYLQNKSGTGSPLDTYYNGAKGLLYFDSLGGTTYTGGNKVPVENCGTGSPAGCGQGTFNSHWRYAVFGNQSPFTGQSTELMIGYLQAGAHVSKLTVASMEDLGYTVNYAAAEPYGHTFSAPPASFQLVPPPLIPLGNDVIRVPLEIYDPVTRRVVGIYRP